MAISGGVSMPTRTRDEWRLTLRAGVWFKAPASILAVALVWSWAGGGPVALASGSLWAVAIIIGTWAIRRPSGGWAAGWLEPRSDERLSVLSLPVQAALVSMVIGGFVVALAAGVSPAVPLASFLVALIGPFNDVSVGWLRRVRRARSHPRDISQPTEPEGELRR